MHVSGVSGRREGGTDSITQGQGVHAGAPDGAGEGAVFLHYDTLFSGFDSHNFGAAGSAGLRLVMRMNGCGSFRELWEKGGLGGGCGCPGMKRWLRVRCCAMARSGCGIPGRRGMGCACRAMTTLQRVLQNGGERGLGCSACMLGVVLQVRNWADSRVRACCECLLVAFVDAVTC